MRIKKLKTKNSVMGALRHNERSVDVVNADPSKKADNKLLAGVSRGVSRAHHIFGYEVGKIRKNAVHGIEVLMTASPEAFDSSESFTTEFSNRSMAWLKKEFEGAEIVSAVLHLDESTPHIHAVIIPTALNKNDDKKLNAKAYVGGSKHRLSEMQDTFAEAHASLGLSRGVKGSKIKHERISRMYARTNDDAERTLKELRSFKPVRSNHGLLVKESDAEKVTTANQTRIKKLKKKVIDAVSGRTNDKNKMKAQNAVISKIKEKRAAENEELEAMKRDFAGIDKDILEKALKQARDETKKKANERIADAEKRAQTANLAYTELNSKDVDQSEREAVKKNRANHKLHDTDLGL